MNSFKELIVWQKSMELAKLIYEATYSFPKAETFGLASQMQRAAVSIPSNIAEGFSRKHPREFRQFLSIAYSSAAELETQLILSEELKFITKDNFEKLSSIITEVRKMLNRLIIVVQQQTSLRTKH